jgi:hypothetical protein
MLKSSGSNPTPASMASFETLVRKVKETFLLGRERIEERNRPVYMTLS